MPSGPAAPRTGRRTSAGSSPSSSGPTGPSRASSSSTLPREQVEIVPQPADHPVRRTAVRWSRDGGALYWLTNRDSEFLRLARYDLVTKEETPLTAHIPWDIEEYDISGNGNSIVLVANEDGQSRLHVIDARTGRRRATPRLADGLISNISFRPRSQEFAFTWSSPQSPPGIYSYDLATRWKTEWIKPRPASPQGRHGRAPGTDPLRVVRRPPDPGIRSSSETDDRGAVSCPDRAPRRPRVAVPPVLLITRRLSRGRAWDRSRLPQRPGLVGLWPRV